MNSISESTKIKISKEITTKQQSTSYFISVISIDLISYPISAYFFNENDTLSSLSLSTGTVSSSSPFYTWIFIGTGIIKSSTEPQVNLNIDVGQSPLISFLGNLTGYISFNEQTLIEVNDTIMIYSFNYQEKILIFTFYLKNISSLKDLSNFPFSFNLTLKATNNKLPLSCNCDEGFEPKTYNIGRNFTQLLIPTAYKRRKGVICKPTSKQLVENRFIQCSKKCKTTEFLTVDKKNLTPKGSYVTNRECCQQFIVNTFYQNNKTYHFCKYQKE